MAFSLLAVPHAGLATQVRNPAIAAIRAAAQELCFVGSGMRTAVGHDVEDARDLEVGALILTGERYGRTLEKAAEVLAGIDVTGWSAGERGALEETLVELAGCEARAFSVHPRWKRALELALAVRAARRSLSPEEKDALAGLERRPAPHILRRRVLARLARLRSRKP